MSKHVLGAKGFELGDANLGIMVCLGFLALESRIDLNSSNPGTYTPNPKPLKTLTLKPTPETLWCRSST